jgi:hypothetical protein
MDDRAIIGVGNKRGAVDGRGRMAIEPKFEFLAYFENGLALFREGGQYGMVDRNGDVVIPASYERLGRFEKTGMAEATSRGVTVWIDRTGKVVEPPPATPPSRPTPSKTETPVHVCEGAVPMSDGSKWGFADSTGKMFIPPRYDHVGCFKRGLAWAAISERREWCVIDKRGEIADRQCQCQQPLAIFERPFNRPAQGSRDCYQAGLDSISGKRPPR